ncbi:hypothetical protein [Roseivirga thermotolerans]|uniref:hypothetical protein n=1 Tax=Roseivirga thermotolerans TaxID=1758176 RepID=UPI00273F988A|nr:hypothetical protein [Roseivirga thermotolerans]
MTHRLILMAGLILTALFPLSAQTNAVEIVADPTSVSFETVSMGEKGFAILEKHMLEKSRSYHLKVHFYNPQLVLQQTVILPLDVRTNILRTDFNNGQLYLLTQKTILRNELSIIKFNEKYEFTEIKVPLFESKEVWFFEVVNNKALFAGLFDARSTAFLLDMTNGTIQTLQGLYSQTSNLVQCTFDEKWEVVSIITSHYNTNKDLGFELKNYDSQGRLVRQHVFNPLPGYQLHVSSVSDFAGGRQLIAGFYTLPKSQGYSGIFHVMLDQESKKDIVLTPFYEIEGFFSHLGEKRANKVVSKAKEKVAKKGKWSTETEATLFPIQTDGNHFFLSMTFYRSLQRNRNSSVITLLENQSTRYLALRFTLNISHHMLAVVNQKGELAETLHIDGQYTQQTSFNNFVQSTFQGQTGLIARNEKELYGGVIKPQNKSPFAQSLEAHLASRQFKVYNSKLIEWHQNKILVTLLEGQMDKVGNVQRVFRVIPVTVE